MRRILVGAALLAFVSPAGADDIPTLSPASPEEISLQGYAIATPRCAEWSDGCAICARENSAARCSTPGIACQPGPIVCRREVDR